MLLGTYYSQVSYELWLYNPLVPLVFLSTTIDPCLREDSTTTAFFHENDKVGTLVHLDQIRHVQSSYLWDFAYCSLKCKRLLLRRTLCCRRLLWIAFAIHRRPAFLHTPVKSPSLKFAGIYCTNDFKFWNII